jgi:hypothetical protein
MKSRHNGGSAAFSFNHVRLLCVDRKFWYSLGLRTDAFGGGI